jgi:hypothetical protein
VIGHTVTDSHWAQADGGAHLLSDEDAQPEEVTMDALKMMVVPASQRLRRLVVAALVGTVASATLLVATTGVATALTPTLTFQQCCDPNLVLSGSGFTPGGTVDVYLLYQYPSPPGLHVPVVKLVESTTVQANPSIRCVNTPWGLRECYPVPGGGTITASLPAAPMFDPPYHCTGGTWIVEAVDRTTGARASWSEPDICIQ